MAEWRSCYSKPAPAKGKQIRGSEVKDQKIDDFIAEVIALERKHGLAISHQDNHGAFIIVPFAEVFAEWLNDADNGVEGDA